jgi:putative flippase GtrA
MRTFFKFQLSSFLSTVIDFSVTLLLTENLKILYIISSVIGYVTGGITNFLINKKWVFKIDNKKKIKRVLLYAMVWIISLLLNTLVLYLLTDIGKINYIYSKIIASLLVGIVFSFFAQLKIVFYA